jgi:hypothetical protein
MAFESDYETVLAVTARRNRLDDAIADLTGDSEFTPIVRRLGCLRGVSTLTAFALAVDWHRFTGNSIGSFVGLVPCEHSSGASRVQGSITKTGNGHTRRLLVETAWHHRARYAPGKTMHDRWLLAHRPPATAAKPAPARPLGPVQPAPQATGHRQRRHRPPRTRRLVLVPGRHGLTATHDRFVHTAAVAARGATRESAMSNRPQAGHARP